MTTEQLQNGKKIAEKIDQLETQLAGWNESDRLFFDTIPLHEKSGNGRQLNLSREYVDFEVLKTLTIARIEKELNELKTEFEKL